MILSSVKEKTGTKILPEEFPLIARIHFGFAFPRNFEVNLGSILLYALVFLIGVWI